MVIREVEAGFLLLLLAAVGIFILFLFELQNMVSTMYFGTFCAGYGILEISTVYLNDGAGCTELFIKSHFHLSTLENFPAVQ